mmetsp:Transcript_33249/g.80436  ORF Transcript_33249/g.80436 Transcript_33249/m.80436 type:complete len:716 (+) Transcript_33249:31-2178(+)
MITKIMTVPSTSFLRRTSPTAGSGAASSSSALSISQIAACCLTAALVVAASAAVVDGAEEAADDNNPCLLYLAQSTIPNAGLGVFAGVPFLEGEQVGRVGDAAFPVVDQDWHNSPNAGGTVSKHEADYHWPLTNYDWSAPDIGMGDEAEDVSVTVTGFGAAPNCHFRLLNVNEHAAHYDNSGLDRYTSPGAGASTPWFNRTSTAARDIEAGSELFVDYGPNWFLSRTGPFTLVPVSTSYEKAQQFLKQYGRLLVGSDKIQDLIEDKMSLDDDAQRDLWDVIKTFPYPTRERQALPDNHQDAIRSIHGDIQVIEKENSIRSVEYLRDHGKCVDNIVPKQSSIPHAGKGAIATRFIPKGGLVAPAPLVLIADAATANMYSETIGPKGNIVRDEEGGVINKQIIINYMFGHPNSTVLLFPYSSNVAYINHHAVDYNAEVRWAGEGDFSFFHHPDWLDKPVEFLEEQWASGLLLEFIALRDIKAGEEVLINYGDEWQKAWDEHLEKWEPIPVEHDYNNLTLWTEPSATNSGKSGYIRAEVLNLDADEPIRTTAEQVDSPYPHAIHSMCTVNVNHISAYLFEPETAPYFAREWSLELDMRDDADDRHIHKCSITERYFRDDTDDSEDEDEEEVETTMFDAHKYLYTIELEVQKQSSNLDPITERHEISNVPRKAISFANMRYTSDAFLKNSFRHEMKLPDEIFPKAWMNLIHEVERESEE